MPLEIVFNPVTYYKEFCFDSEQEKTFLVKSFCGVKILVDFEQEESFSIRYFDIITSNEDILKFYR